MVEETINKLKLEQSGFLYRGRGTQLGGLLPSQASSVRSQETTRGGGIYSKKSLRIKKKGESHAGISLESPHFKCLPDAGGRQPST